MKTYTKLSSYTLSALALGVVIVFMSASTPSGAAVHTLSLPYHKITAVAGGSGTIGSPDGPAYTVVSNAYGVLRFCDKHNLIYIASPSLSVFYNSMPETGSGYWGMTNVMQMQVLKGAC